MGYPALEKVRQKQGHTRATQRLVIGASGSGKFGQRFML